MTSPPIHDHMHEWQPYPQIQALKKPFMNPLQLESLPICYTMNTKNVGHHF